MDELLQICRANNVLDLQFSIATLPNIQQTIIPELNCDHLLMLENKPGKNKTATIYQIISLGYRQGWDFKVLKIVKKRYLKKVLKKAKKLKKGTKKVKKFTFKPTNNENKI